MKFDKIKKLKQQIKQLKEENKFLQVGIDTREDAYNFVSEQLDKAMALQQELTYILLYMEVIEGLIKDDFSANAKTIKRAITKFKMELMDGFAKNHCITHLKTDNKLDISDINNTNHEV